MTVNKQRHEVPPGKFFTHLADRAMQFHILKLAIEISKIPPDELTPTHPKLIELREATQSVDVA